MIVSRQTLDEVIAELKHDGVYGLDTETTGLKETDRLFSIVISDAKESFYFNFHPYADIDFNHILPRECISWLKPIFQNPKSTWLIHNAKFDLRMLFYENILIQGKVICTQAMERVLRNNLLSFNLKECAKRRGLKKDEAVEDYIKKHKLYSWEGVPGKGTPQKLKRFYEVPFEIITKYGEMDARIARFIGVDQQQKFVEIATEGPHAQALANVVSNEIQLTKTCFEMERLGIQIDRVYTTKAKDYETAEIEKLTSSFSDLTGIQFNDGRTCLTQAFTKVGEKYPLTEKGNPSFASPVLEEMESPLAKLVLDIRHHQKILGTYYSSFLYLADHSDRIHPNIRQDGTETGRMSYSNPNLQNVPKQDEDEDSPFLVRACFVPRDGFFFLSMDYKQQEFRMMLDYAGQKSLIERVNDGEDVHQATADIMGVSRKFAKTINFGLLYGMGVGKLAKSLSISEAQAKDLRGQYFDRFPAIQVLLSRISEKAKSQGYITNWLGRRCHLLDPEYAYIMPNHLIQGGAADVVKVAMNKIHRLIQPYASKMVLQVHDEILFEFHEGDVWLIPEIQKIMESAYKPKNGIKMAVDIEHSFKSWGARDKIKGVPDVKTARSKV